MIPRAARGRLLAMLAMLARRGRIMSLLGWLLASWLPSASAFAASALVWLLASWLPSARAWAEAASASAASALGWLLASWLPSARAWAWAAAASASAAFVFLWLLAFALFSVFIFFLLFSVVFGFSRRRLASSFFRFVRLVRLFLSSLSMHRRSDVERLSGLRVLIKWTFEPLPSSLVSFVLDGSIVSFVLTGFVSFFGSFASF